MFSRNLASLLLFGSAASAVASFAAAPKITPKTGVQTLATVADRTVLAAGSVFEITGEALGPADPIAAEVPYPQTLGEVTAQITSVADATTSWPAFVISVSASRIVALVPSAVPPGDYNVTASFNSETSNAFQVKIASASFGLLTSTGVFAGMAQGRVLVDGIDPAAISFTNPIAAGATIEFDATGLGPIDTADNEFPAEANLSPDAVLVIGGGGLQFPVTYLGRNPAKPGYDKLVLTVPADAALPSGCLVSAQVKIGDSLTVPFTLPLLAPGETVCSPPLGMTPEGLATLLAGGSIIRGSFTLVRLFGQTSAGSLTVESKVDSMSGGFARFTAGMIADQIARSVYAATYDVNGCKIYDALAGGLSPEYVDAGPSLRLTDPSWQVDLPRSAAPALNQYNLTLNSLFNGAPAPGQNTPKLLMSPGRHTLTGAGGAVIGPFSVNLDVSTEMVWTNMSEIKEVDSSKDLVLTFSGAGPNDTVTASALVKGPAPEDPSKIVSRIWECLAKGADGKVVAPSYILQKLPKVTAGELADGRSGRYSSLTLASYNPDGTGIFRAPLTAGGSTELIPFIFSYTSSKVPVPVK